MDVRLSAKSDPQPVVGLLSAVGAGAITIDIGEEKVTLIVDDRSYLRLKDGAQQPVSKMRRFLQVDEQMMAGRDGDQAWSSGRPGADTHLDDRCPLDLDDRCPLVVAWPYGG